MLTILSNFALTHLAAAAYAKSAGAWFGKSDVGAKITVVPQPASAGRVSHGSLSKSVAAAGWFSLVFAKKFAYSVQI
jgi:hypothetical protein